ncbi:MAG: efflux RND transporter periplasmic adaptor subunit [Anaerolineae bacterium]|nr:efflux RND transporter periplasmic adaptor subunit [Anaerolineae bacterium]
MKRVALVAVLVAMAGVIAYFLWHPGGGARAADVGSAETVVVSRQTLTSEVAASGSVSAERQVSLSFKTPARVAEVYVEEGQQVVAGQPLAAQETAELELQLQLAQTALRLAEAQAERSMAPAAQEDIAAARAALHSARAAYDRALEGPTAEQITMAEVQLKKAEIALQRAQTAYDEVKWVGAIAALPQALSLQAATLDYEAAKANYELQTRQAQPADLAALAAQIAQAEAQLARLERGPTAEDRRVLELQVEQARLNLEQVQLQLDNAVLRAPFDGLVATVNVEPGQIAATGLPAITLVDCGRYHINVQVDEADVGRVAVGQPAVVEPEAFPGLSLPGHVANIGITRTVAEEATTLVGGSGVVQYAVRVEVDEPFDRLRPGMTAQVLIQVDRREDALVVPNRAVRLDRETGITYVEKLVNGDPVRAEVILGVQELGMTEVLAGLEEGEVVILPSSSSLEELRRTFIPTGD